MKTFGNRILARLIVFALIAGGIRLCSWAGQQVPPTQMPTLVPPRPTATQPAMSEAAYGALMLDISQRAGQHFNAMFGIFGEANANLDLVTSSAWQARVFAELDAMQAINVDIRSLRAPAAYEASQRELLAYADEADLFITQFRLGLPTVDLDLLNKAVDHLQAAVDHLSRAGDLLPGATGGSG